jgi:Tol biopolymer transport system component
MTQKTTPLIRTRLSVLAIATVLSAQSGCSPSQTRGFSFGARYADGGSFAGAQPVLAPDGNTIVFAAPGKYASGSLFAVAVADGRIRPLIAQEHYTGQAQISPDGSKLVYVSEQRGMPGIWIANIDGRSARRLTDSQFAEQAPIFSPDGQSIAFVRRLTTHPDDRLHDELFVIDLDGRSERRLTNDEYEDTPVRFAQDGRSLYFSSGRSCDDVRKPSHHRSHLFKLSLDDSLVQCVLALGVKGVGGCDISANEKTLVYIDDPSEPFAYDLYAVDLDGSNKRRLTHLRGYIGSVSFGFHADQVTLLVEPNRDGLGYICLYRLSDEVMEKVVSTTNAR